MAVMLTMLLAACTVEEQEPPPLNHPEEVEEEEEDLGGPDPVAQLFRASLDCGVCGPRWKKSSGCIRIPASTKAWLMII